MSSINIYICKHTGKTMGITVKDAIKEATSQRKEKVTLEQFGAAMGVTKQYIGQIKDKILSDKQIQMLEKNLQINLTEVNNIGEYINLPVKSDVNASMGYGVSVSNENQTGVYSFSKKLLKDIGANPSYSDIIFSSGDSMYPTIEGGDCLIVDKSKTDIYDGKIYCVRIEGQLYAKRLQKIPPSKIKVISDNKDKYDAFYIDFSKTIDFDFAVIGEVKWWSRVAK